MWERRKQEVLFFLLSLSLSAFLTAHALVVEVESGACLGNLAASVNGDRPYRRVAEMSLGELAYSAGQAISAEQLIIAALGLLPLFPFVIARSVSRDRLSRRLWTVSAILAFIVILCWTVTSDLSEYYDCDLNGVGLGIVFAPILYTAATSAATLALAALRSLFLSATGRE